MSTTTTDGLVGVLGALSAQFVVFSRTSTAPTHSVKRALALAIGPLTVF